MPARPEVAAAVVAIDALLAPAGFAPAQGDPASAGQLIWCAAHPTEPGACVDVVVDLDDDGLVRDAHWEGEPRDVVGAPLAALVPALRPRVEPGG
ncbi:hypothetical protein [Nocardioides sp.]|uniref:hypothetical protein n=1 Tax=Nocardioides sp. TaxID=35761 RepID=UPI003516F39D